MFKNIIKKKEYRFAFQLPNRCSCLPTWLPCPSKKEHPEMQVKDKTERNMSQRRQQRPTEKANQRDNMPERERPHFFQQPILLHLHPRISATPRSDRTSGQTGRVLEHTAPIVLLPTYKPHTHFHFDVKKTDILFWNTQIHVFPWLISCMRWLMQNRQESLRTGLSTEGREKSPSFCFP